MSSAYNKFNVFTINLTDGAHNFSSNTFKTMLTNVAPVATNSVFGDLTEITAHNGYSAGGSASAITESTSSGTVKEIAAVTTFTASGGTIGPFRYVVLYNFTQSSPVKPLVAWWDYGSSITLNDTETFTVNYDQTNGIFTLA